MLWCADTGKNLLKIDMDIRYRRRGTGVFNLLNVAISDDRGER